jgi:hypothetical protein
VNTVVLSLINLQLGEGGDYFVGFLGSGDDALEEFEGVFRVVHGRGGE